MSDVAADPPALPARAPSGPDTDLLALAGALPDAVLLINDAAEVTWANHAAERLFGMTVDEAVGRSGLEFVHPDDLALAALSLESVQGKDVGTLLEMRIRSTDGWRLVEILGAPYGDEVLLTLRDVTERRRWEVAGDQDARLRSIMHNAASITLLLDGEGSVTASSGGLTRLLGHDQEWLEGRNLTDIVTPDDLDTLHRALAETTDPDRDRSTGPVVTEIRLIRAGVGPTPYSLTLTNLLDDPTVEGIVVTGHDIGDRVAAESDLREANSILAATLESTADGILVVDLDGNITSCNSRFVEMWRVPPDVLASRDDNRVLAAVLSQLEDPGAFVAKVQELYAQPDARSHDELEFLDGRVFERDSLPQYIDGRIVGRVWSFRDVSDHRHLQHELEFQAFHDPLTGLSNKVLFRDRLDHALQRRDRTGHDIAVLFIDLDEFKTVNDSLGHSAGDALLVIVTDHVTRCLRPGDTAARLGGDEFAVLVDDLDDPADAVDIANRIIASLDAPIMLGSRKVSATASVGIAYATERTTSDELLRNADLAMYTAKAGGKNRACVFEADMHRAAVERLDLEAHLRGAAARGELVVQYQPMYELSTGRIAAMEALVRWNHPERGRLGPLAFIPFAEESGLIEEIGQHVLETAVAEATRWGRAVGFEDAPAVSVNLSPRQLVDPDLPERVEQLLHRTGLEPAGLILEITESALMREPDRAVASLQRLSRLGVRLAVDDFGTGYSSLAYLQQFPLDLLKIDGKFVNDMPTDGDWSLAEAIVQISHALGLTPIAEGVEHADQAAALSALGCDLAQGYHFARPLDADDALTALLRSPRRTHDDAAPADTGDPRSSTAVP